MPLKHKMVIHVGQKYVLQYEAIYEPQYISLQLINTVKVT